MRQATRNHDIFSLPLGGPLGRGTREGAFIVFAAAALFLLLSFASYHASDPGWSFSRSGAAVANYGGIVGAWLADLFLYLFGYMAYLFPVLIAYAGILVFRERSEEVRFGWVYLAMRGGGLAMTIAAGCGLATIHYGNAGRLPLDAGGIVGNVVGNGLVDGFNLLGGTLVLLTMFLTGITLFTGLSWLSLMDNTGRLTLGLVGYARGGLRYLAQVRRGQHSRRQRETSVRAERARTRKRKPPRIEPSVGRLEPSLRVEKERQVPLFEPPAGSSLPPLSMLEAPDAERRGMSEASLEAMSRQVELKLKDYGIEVEVVAVHPGPVVTRFELKLAPGLKVSRITGLAKDLARSLSTVSVRVVEVIPGKAVIGLEIPNPEVELVRLSEILKSAAYDESSSPLTLALGKDIAGRPLVVNLDRMPHLLVAGTTGSGKSVAINAMVLSLLYKTTAQDVRLILVDPKMLELSVYEHIPHLLAPVVTDMKDAANALRWCVAEMDRRYQIMSGLGVRNIGGYNRKVKEAAARGKPLRSPVPEHAGFAEDAPELEPLPFIVVIVDELADMMMLTGKKVEELIARLAQKARASGIHLILATQRPSVDVITGLIKANIPSRIAFQVSSKVDSRTILDQGGAEQLLGHGDMLYMVPGMPTPTRIHGAFVSDQEVHRVVAHLRGSGEPQYIDDVLTGGGGAGGGEGGPLDGGPDPESDPLYDQAVHLVTESRRASISGVQRRLKIGYNRAARMIEQMEHAGLVGPLQSNGSREVLAAPPPED